MLLTGVIFLASAFVVANAVDQDSSYQLGLLRKKPFGPFYCKAKCVAMCLDTKMASNVSLCERIICNDFGDDKLCPHDDAVCWKNCGRELERHELASPSPVDGLRISDEDPYNVRIEWDDSKTAGLYIIELLSVGTTFSPFEHPSVQRITTQTMFVFPRTDLCENYVVRVMTVSAFGLSTPRFKRLNAWRPDHKIDLNLNVQSVTMDSNFIRVLITADKPETWRDNDVQIVDSVVRARDCSGTLIGGSAFGNIEPDKNGYYWPAVFINESAMGSIELQFSADVVYAKCKFVYKILSLRGPCGLTTNFDINEVTNKLVFALNCGTVDHGNCDFTPAATNGQSATKPKIAIEPMPKNAPIYEDTFRSQPGERKQSLDIDRINAAPRDPWPQENPVNDSWLALETFLPISDQFSRNLNVKNGIAEFTTPLPAAPMVPPSSAEEGNETAEFEKLFVEAFDDDTNETTVSTVRYNFTQLNTLRNESTTDLLNRTNFSKSHSIFATDPTVRMFAGGLTLFAVALVVLIFSAILFSLRKNRPRQPYTVFANV